MSSMTTGVSPHIRSGKTTQRVMLDVIIALCPALIASVVIYGFRALLLTCVSVCICVLLEFVWEKAMKKPVTVSDLSAVVTGMLLAFKTKPEINSAIAGNRYPATVDKSINIT